MLEKAPDSPGTTLLFRPRTLTVEDVMEAVADLPLPAKVQDDSLILEKSLRGWNLKPPVKVPLDKVLAVRERAHPLHHQSFRLRTAQPDPVGLREPITRQAGPALPPKMDRVANDTIHVLRQPLPLQPIPRPQPRHDHQRRHVRRQHS